MAGTPVVAVTNVTFDGRRYRPGQRFKLPGPCAHALAAAGNVEVAEPEREPERDTQPSAQKGAGAGTPAPPPEPPAAPPPEVDGGAAPAPPADAPAPQAANGPVPMPLELVSGIGPSTARRLHAAGIADVAALAEASDEQLSELRIRPDWRDQARELLARAAD